jgi:hypothetical protein
MKQKPLSHTNIYLQDPQKRRQAVVRSVLSSSAVEGIRIDAHELEQLQRVSIHNDTAPPTAFCITTSNSERNPAKSPSRSF